MTSSEEDPVGAHAVGLQPDPHRIGAAAEIPGGAHALDPLDHGQDVDVGEVVKEFLVDALCPCCKRFTYINMLGMIWLTRIPSRCTRGGSLFFTMLTRFCTFTTPCSGPCPARRDPDRRLAGAGGVGGHVAHVLHAVDRLLRAESAPSRPRRWRWRRISNGDLNGRRRDGGELGYRQGLDCQQPQEQEEDRDDDRQCRSMEDFCEHGSQSQRGWSLGKCRRPGIRLRRFPTEKRLLFCRDFFGLPEPVPGDETRIPPSRRREPVGPPRARSCRPHQAPA